MATSADPRLGSVLAGYRIEALLGRGGMGVVYRARDEALDRSVALKLIAPRLASDTDFRDRFLVEARLAASLDHPNVIPVYDAGGIDGQLYLAMRYVEGTDLRELLREEGQLEPERALAICGQVAQALDAAHRKGLVHQDVKPSNVLLDEDGHAYLADFGLTRRLADQAPGLDAGLSLGTPAYVAPEQIRRSEVAGRADQYALACVLYECLSGSPPYRQLSELATLFAHLEHDPPGYPGLDAVFTRALAKNPDERYDSCTALVEAARAALQGPRRRRRRAAALAALVAGAVAAVLAVVLLGGGDSRPSTRPTLDITTDSIQRLDPETNEIVATIAAPVSRGVMAAGGGSVWVGHVDDDVVARIDPETNTVGEPIAGVGNPSGIAVAAGSAWVYNAPDGVVTRLDAETGEVLATIRLPDGSAFNPLDTAPMRVGAGGIWLRWGSATGNAVVIDPRTTRAAAVQVGVPGDSPYDYAFTGDRVWTVGAGFGRGPSRPLIGFDPERPSRADVVVPLGELPDAPCVFASDVYAWVGSGFPSGPALTQVDLTARRVLRRIEVGDGPCLMAVAHGSLWVANSGDGTVSRVDPDSAEVTATIEVGPNLLGIAADEHAVWVDVHPEEPAFSP